MRRVEARTALRGRRGGEQRSRDQQDDENGDDASELASSRYTARRRGGVGIHVGGTGHTACERRASRKHDGTPFGRLRLRQVEDENAVADAGGFGGLGHLEGDELAVVADDAGFDAL